MNRFAQAMNPEATSRIWELRTRGVSVPDIAAEVGWGLFISPKATVPLPWPAAFGIEAVLFIGTGTGLFLIGLGLPAAIGVVLWLVDRIAIALLRS